MSMPAISILKVSTTFLTRFFSSSSKLHFLGAEAVFSIASSKLRADTTRKVNQLFKRLRLQDRARLNGTPMYTANENLMEMTCDINYINLEENKPGTVGLKFSLQNATA